MKATILTEDQSKVLESDLAELVGKIEAIKDEFEDMDLSELSSLNIYLKKIKGFANKTSIFSFAFIVLLSSIVGFLFAFYTTSNTLVKKNIEGLTIVSKGDETKLYIPKETTTLSSLKDVYVLTFKKSQK